MIRFDEVLHDISDLADVVIDCEAFYVVTRRIAKSENNILYFVYIFYYNYYYIF